MAAIDAPAPPSPAQATVDAASLAQDAARRLRHALGCYPTGVTVVTTRAPDGRPVGLTVNSFASLSLEPPLLLWSLSNRSPSLRAFRSGSHFAINVLAHGQQALAQRFANPRVVDKFEGVDLLRPATHEQSGHDVPVLSDSAAWFVCACRDAIETGDHTLFIGRIEAYDSVVPQAPLVFHAGAFTALA